MLCPVAIGDNDGEPPGVVLRIGHSGGGLGSHAVTDEGGVAVATRGALRRVPARPQSLSSPRARGVLCALAVLLAAACATLAPCPLPPAVALASVRVVRLTPVEAQLSLVLAVQNPNPYDLAMSALEANLAVDGTALVRATLAAPVVLAAGAQTRVEIDARAGIAAALATLDRIARQPAVGYEVTGTAVVQDGWRLPFARRGELPVGAFLGQKR